MYVCTRHTHTKQMSQSALNFRAYGTCSAGIGNLLAISMWHIAALGQPRLAKKTNLNALLLPSQKTWNLKGTSLDHAHPTIFAAACLEEYCVARFPCKIQWQQRNHPTQTGSGLIGVESTAPARDSSGTLGIERVDRPNKGTKLLCVCVCHSK